MKLIITGDLRDIANSAWVSTISEARAESRSDEDVDRVVDFLVDNHHTSPFESVTLTFIRKAQEGFDEEGYHPLRKAEHFRTEVSNGEHIQTVDLLNFIKAIIKRDRGFQSSQWAAFSEHRPKLAEAVEKFSALEYHPAHDVSDELGEHNMSVELISLHNPPGLSDSHCRVTWRVKCPLSVSVQILRHRTGSYNMVSGRYKTIRQEMLATPDDCQKIAEKFGENIDKYFGAADASVARYLQMMRKAKKAKDDEVISNYEYKRLREVTRFILPEGRMTELYITYYLDDFYGNYIKLRDSEHAQTEHIWIAQEMQRTLQSEQNSGG
jgi:flavin-dependent thymidylate synthase